MIAFVFMKASTLLFGLVGIGAAVFAYKKFVSPAKAALPTGGNATTPPAGGGTSVHYTGNDYNLATATAQKLDPTGAATASYKVGDSILFSRQNGSQIWAGPGVTSSNETVVAPGKGTMSGFVAVGPGAAVITGYFQGDDGQLAKESITIMVG